MGQRKPWKKRIDGSIGAIMRFRTSYTDSIPDLVVSYCVASCGEWSVILNPASRRECFLWNRISYQKIRLPQMPKDFCASKCILSAPPTQPVECIVFFFSKDTPLILYSKVGHLTWTRMSYHFGHPDFILTQVISCNGKIYILDNGGSLQEMVVFKPAPHGPFPPHSQEPPMLAEKQDLVDSCGEVFLVQRFSVSKLAVFKMDFSSNAWVKIQSLGDRVFFLSCNYSVSLSAAELGIQGNCIYFTEDDEKSLYVFNFGDESLSVSPHSPNSGAFWFSFNGLMPVLRLPDNPTHEKLREEEEEVNDTKKVGKVEDNEDVKSIYLELPLDLQKLIANYVSVGRDYMNFRAVCRTWRSLAPPCHWSYDPANSTTIRYPWLMFFEREKGRCNFCDPGDKVTYHMNITELSPDCIIRFAQEGWLLVSQGARSIFLFQPFTKTRIQLPDLPEDYCFNGICFSASPTSSNCVIFGIARRNPEVASIFCLYPTRIYWVRRDFRNGRPFLLSWSNPVFLDGLFYCLGQDGSLGIFELVETEFTWKILNKPQQLMFPSSVCRSYLVSFDEELLSVFVGNLGKWIHVYKLDTFKSEWVKLRSLGDCMLFVSQTSSLALMAKEETMKNKIYFPIFSKTNGNNMFYSLETCLFQTFENDHDHSSGDLYDTKEQLHCTWVQPRLVPTFR